METRKKCEIKPFDKDSTPLSFRFSMLAKKYYGAAAKQFADISLERYFYILTVIGSYEYVTQQSLCDSLDVDKASMVRIIDHLSDKGLVKREVNPADRREHIIRVTAKANKLIPAIKETFDTLNCIAFKGFSSGEVALFYKMTNTMLANLCTVPAEKLSVKYIKTKVKK